MKADKNAREDDLSCIPGEFRENYRFLSELIDCKNKNDSAAQTLGNFAGDGLGRLRGKLNRRQVKILKQFLESIVDEDGDSLFPPVPAELEASIRIKKRSIWLPWEAEAIRKIDTWRRDVSSIQCHLHDTPSLLPLNLTNTG